MKAKKILAGMLAVATLAACVSFSGCQTLYEVAPKAYGEWDGNYIYRGNVRSKTTGVGDEYLIESVTHEGVEYAVTETTDFTYVGDNIYLCLQLWGDAKEWSSCLARYNVKDKTSEAIYLGTDDLSAFSVYKMTNNFIILSNGYSEGGLFRIDYEGNILSKDENALYGYTEVGEYLLDLEDGKFSYRHWEEDAFTEMFTLPHKVNNFQAEYVERDGKTGFLINVHSPDDQGQNLGGAYFYDLEGTMYELIDLKDKQECYLEDGYILTGERVEGRYQYYSTDWKSFDLFLFEIVIPWRKTNIVHYSMLQNCKLYKIDWTAEEELLQEVYDFTEEYPNLDFTRYSLLKDGRIFFTAKEVRQGSGCNGEGRMENPYFILSPETGVLEETDDYEGERESKTELELALENGQSCGEYIYFGRSGGYGITEPVHYLYRYHTETETLETMQFWREFAESSENDYEVETEEGTVRFRWSPKMWRYVDGASEFIVRNY